MNPKIKISLYAVLIAAAAVFAGLFYSSYKNLNKIPEPIEQLPAAPDTNNLRAKDVPATNVAGQTDQPEPTNAISTNEVATNIAVTEPMPPPPAIPTLARPPVKGRSTMIGYFAAFLGTAVLLGLLIARDLSEYFANRSVDFMFNDEGVGIKNPEYEEAEQEWANGHHLDAIRMMRDYLTRHPREQYVALRIAEIYEKDLKNFLAAALEYEEVLKHKLPPERWGWAAIHLCNIYSNMGKTDQAVALLRRIESEYSQTAAAKKARQRLATFETVGEAALDGDLPDSIQPEPPAKIPKEEEKPSSNLPPGFRPKK